MKMKYVIGVDFGSDSARALIVDALSGQEIAEASAEYPRWRSGLYQNAGSGMYRQHPRDYIEALTVCVREALRQAGDPVRREIAALAVDTTGSTPCPIDQQGTPLALTPGFEEDPNAMFHLWKDHTAVAEAAQITEAFRHNSDKVDYTVYQGAYASEWFWAKILHTLRVSETVRTVAWSWVEHSDWLPGLLVGHTRPETMYRCACAAGHKAYWHSAWNGLPSETCLAQVGWELLQVRRTYGTNCKPSTHCLGRITPSWAERLNLNTDVRIGGSSFDAHAGAVGAGVNRERMVVNLGTSSVNLFVIDASVLRGKEISWLCGAAQDSILPGLIGLETGQAAFGDLFAWFKRLLLDPLQSALAEDAAPADPAACEDLIRALNACLLPQMQRLAQAVPPEEAPVVLDWFNGRRYPYVNESVLSSMTGLSMGTTSPALYRGLLQAAAFGQKRIIEAMENEGIVASEIITVGGIAQKSALCMQILSDVLGRKVSVSKTRQACALGAAMYAAVAAGLYPNLPEAQARMCQGYTRTYVPDPVMTRRYEPLYAKYLRLAAFMDTESHG